MSRKPMSQSTSQKLFDFKCPKCEHVFEAFASESEISAGSIRHADCDQPAVRQISAVGIDRSAASAWRR
jgi:hypothetical protein